MIAVRGLVYFKYPLLPVLETPQPPEATGRITLILLLLKARQHHFDRVSLLDNLHTNIVSHFTGDPWLIESFLSSISNRRRTMLIVASQGRDS